METESQHKARQRKGAVAHLPTHFFAYALPPASVHITHMEVSESLSLFSINRWRPHARLNRMPHTDRAAARVRSFRITAAASILQPSEYIRNPSFHVNRWSLAAASCSDPAMSIATRCVGRQCGRCLVAAIFSYFP